MKRLYYAISGVVASLALALSASAETYTTSTIPTAFGSTLSGIVNDMITTVISFLTTNLPVIVILGVSVGLVFWLIRKARAALGGSV
jgi:ABC-type Co2+ transport system permease subunit